MIDLEVVCFQIITAVGEARSSFIMAIAEAKKGNFDKAQELIETGNEVFAQGHHIHVSLFTEGEIEKEFSKQHILLMHAEDQLMSAESFKILAVEFIDMYKLLLAGE